MKKKLFQTAAAVLAISALGFTGAEAGKAKDIVAPLSVSDSAAPDSDMLAELWVDGRRQEMAGLAQVEDGEKLLRKSQKEEHKASAKLQKATIQSDEQRAAYARLVSGFGGAATPAAVETEIKALKKAADDWKDAYERVEKAQAKLNDARTAIANGQSEIRTGAELAEAGRDKMRRAEIQSQPAYYSDEPTSSLIAGDPVELVVND